MTVLSRQIAELGIYPAVDPLDSTSRMLDPSVVGSTTTILRAWCSECCRTTSLCRTSSRSLGWTSSPRRTSSLSPAPARSSGYCPALLRGGDLHGQGWPLRRLAEDH